MGIIRYMYVNRGYGDEQLVSYEESMRGTPYQGVYSPDQGVQIQYQVAQSPYQGGWEEQV